MALGYYRYQERLIADGKYITNLKCNMVICDESLAAKDPEPLVWNTGEKGYPVLNRVDSNKDVLLFNRIIHSSKKKNIFRGAGVQVTLCKLWIGVDQNVEIQYHYEKRNPSLNDILNYKNTDLAIQYLEEHGLKNLTIAK